MIIQEIIDAAENYGVEQSDITEDGVDIVLSIIDQDKVTDLQWEISMKIKIKGSDPHISTIETRAFATVWDENDRLLELKIARMKASISSMTSEQIQETSDGEEDGMKWSGCVSIVQKDNPTNTKKCPKSVEEIIDGAWNRITYLTDMTNQILERWELFLQQERKVGAEELCGAKLTPVICSICGKLIHYVCRTKEGVHYYYDAVFKAKSDEDGEHDEISVEDETPKWDDAHLASIKTYNGAPLQGFVCQSCYETR